MINHLFMICPTDHIEYIIHQNFYGQKYFYTSLGNSFSMGRNELSEIIQIIKKYRIEDITFIISENNKIIFDANQEQYFIGIRGLKKTYSNINSKGKMTDQMWLSHDHHILFLSYFLIDKINKLKEHLRNNSMPTLKVDAKIYSKAYNSFKGIYHEILLSDPIRIN